MSSRKNTAPFVTGRLLLAGILVVGCGESRAPEATPTALLGPPTGKIPVGNEPRALELADGRVALTMMGLAGVVVYDFGASRADTSGRRGEGPGEYQRSDAVVALGGSRFAVLDPVRRRATFYAKPGAVDSVVVFAADHMEASERLSVVTGWVGEGGRGANDSIPLLRRRFDANASDTVARIHRPPSRLIPLGAIAFNYPIEYTPADLWGVIPDGRIWIARGGVNRVDWITPDGRRIMGPAIPYTPVATVAADQHTWQGMPAPPIIDTVKREMAAQKAPFQGAVAAADGRVWLWLNQAAGYTTEQYLVVGADGQPEMRVTVPLAHKVITVSPRFVYILGEDADGDWVITRHALPAPQ
jgi:hypothetical protein